jgi:hypothetical protein
MKLKAVSIVLPLADLRPLCAPLTRFHFLSPLTARPGHTRLKGFGNAGSRDLRIPWRPAEIVFFRCHGSVSLPAKLPDGTGVTRHVRRVYFDNGAAVRFDLSIFSNPRHQGPPSNGAIADWFRAYWDGPFTIYDKREVSQDVCPSLLAQLARKLITASTAGAVVRKDLVEILSPILTAVIQEAPAALGPEFKPLDTERTLFLNVRRLSIARSNESVLTACIGHAPGKYLEARHSDFRRLRLARLIAAWLHTDLEVLLSITRRLGDTGIESGLVEPYIDDCADALISILSTGTLEGLSLKPFVEAFANPIALLAAALEKIGRRETASRLRMLSDRALQPNTAERRPSTRRIARPEKLPAEEGSPSLDPLINEALARYASVLGSRPPSGSRYDDSAFNASATRKAQEVIARLPPSGPFVFVSIGGSDGTELLELMTKTGSSHGVLLEFADEAVRTAEARAASLGLKLVTLTGDAMQKVNMAMAQARQISDRLDKAPIVVTIMALLHELPSRSPGFDLTTFFSSLRGASVVLGREPIAPSNWTERVILGGNFTGERFAALANRVVAGMSARLRPHRDPGPLTVNALTVNTVMGPGALIMETLVKSFYAADILYELDECVTSFTEQDILSALQNSFTDSYSVTSSLATSHSILRFWRRYALTVKDPKDSRPLGAPSSHLWYEAVHRTTVLQ